jgi:hypothetical protein
MLGKNIYVVNYKKYFHSIVAVITANRTCYKSTL